MRDPLDSPALLVSYVYLKGFANHRARYQFRDWMLDSGAFSAWKSGKPIDLNSYIAVARRQRLTDPKLREIIALDVIGDGRASHANAVRMRDAGLDVMPVFHHGDDWALLRDYLDGWTKVGLSCRLGESKSDSSRFYDRCFAIGWPHRFHSLGWVDEDVLTRYPFHSADTSTWETGPAQFGYWKAFGRRVQVKDRNQSLRAEVQWYLNLERKIRARWNAEMKRLDPVHASTLPVVRLAVQQMSPNQVARSGLTHRLTTRGKP